MTENLLTADLRALREPFTKRLLANGPRATYLWLADVLASQSAPLRSSNCTLIAYTGCLDALDWIEANVASPVTTNWGQGAALLGAPWPRLTTWLATSGPLQMMALGTLVAYRCPAPNMAPLVQIAAPMLPDAPAREVFETTVANILQSPSAPRIRSTVNHVLSLATEILAPRSRGVSVADLPSLYLKPEVFPNTQAILNRHDAVVSNVRTSIRDLLS